MALSDISLSNFMDIKVGSTPIGHLEGFSGISEETAIIEVKQYNRVESRKLPASTSVGAIEITQGLVTTDAGYIALMAAKKSRTPVDFEVIYYMDEAKTASKADKRTFSGYVTSYSETGELESHRQCTWSIAVDGGVTYASAAAAAAAK
ncbi:hypothetical protein WN238_001486 [Vibrio parahaemolyticus]